MTTRSSCDAIIVGSGPAGTTSAALLAEKGHRIVVIEKEAFPRYKIGESLIPHCWFALERLGLIDALNESGFAVRKQSVQFVGTDGVRARPFYFTDYTDHPKALTWQVVRSEFDRLLVENAIAKGAEIRFETAARSLIQEEGRVVGIIAETPSGDAVELRAPIVIDASGRDVFSQSRLGWRISDPKLKKVALWTYYRGAMRDPGVDGGATTIAYVPEKGWFWYIPLADDLVSVGIVAEKSYLYRETRDSKEIFDREVSNQPWVRAHLAPGKQIGKFRVTGEYSYRSRHCAQDGLLLIGDAFAFLDPVFSSGVFLALHSGVMAADAVHAALKAGDTSAWRFAQYGEKFCKGIESMRRLVYAFYDHHFSFGDFLEKYPQFREDLTECLIGNVERDFEPLFKAANEFADIPAPLLHGAPLTSKLPISKG